MDQTSALMTEGAGFLFENGAAGQIRLSHDDCQAGVGLEQALRLLLVAGGVRSAQPSGISPVSPPIADAW